MQMLEKSAVVLEEQDLLHRKHQGYGDVGSSTSRESEVGKTEKRIGPLDWNSQRKHQSSAHHSSSRSSSSRTQTDKQRTAVRLSNLATVYNNSGHGGRKRDVAEIPSAKKAVRDHLTVRHSEVITNKRSYSEHIEGIRKSATGGQVRNTQLGGNLKKVQNPKDKMIYYMDEEGGFW